MCQKGAVFIAIFTFRPKMCQKCAIFSAISSAIEGDTVSKLKNKKKVPYSIRPNMCHIQSHMQCHLQFNQICAIQGGEGEAEAWEAVARVQSQRVYCLASVSLNFH
jgi:hypothetical protein